MKTKLRIVVSLTFLVLLIGTLSQRNANAIAPEPAPPVSHLYVTLSAAGTSDFCYVQYRGQFADLGWINYFVDEDESPWFFDSNGYINEVLNYNWVYIKVRIGVHGPVYYCEGTYPTYWVESAWCGEEDGEDPPQVYFNLDSSYPFACPI